MRYSDLIEELARKTHQPQTVVRDILRELPELLKTLKIKERAQTPLGLFKGTYRKPREVSLPKGGKSEVTERVSVRLKTSMHVEPGERLWNHVTSKGKT